MAAKAINPKLQALLEYGPIAAFVVAYLVYRNDTFLVGGREYSGFIAVTAVFLPIFVLAIGALWALTGRITRMQIAVTGMLVVLGGLSIWLNDPTLIKMKPTIVYGLLTILLGIGLLRGKLWLKFVIEEMIPLQRKGWVILTKRVTLVFFVSAVANEIVWRTQSETVWVIFETLVMPLVILIFFLTQIGLFVEYAQLKPKKARKRPKNRKG